MISSRRAYFPASQSSVQPSRTPFHRRCISRRARNRSAGFEVFGGQRIDQPVQRRTLLLRRGDWGIHDLELSSPAEAHNGCHEKEKTHGTTGCYRRKRRAPALSRLRRPLYRDRPYAAELERGGRGESGGRRRRAVFGGGGIFHFMLACCDSAIGRLEEAKEGLQRAFELGSGISSSGRWTSLIWRRIRSKKRIVDARRVFVRAFNALGSPSTRRNCPSALLACPHVATHLRAWREQLGERAEKRLAQEMLSV
jgi:hypothetical protein